MIKIVNENSTITLVISFTDENGNSVVPNSVQYKITNEDGTIIKDWTDVIPSSTINIEIDGNLNVIQNPNKREEMRYITVKSTINQGIFTDEYKYVVSNLKGIP